MIQTIPYEILSRFYAKLSIRDAKALTLAFSLKSPYRQTFDDLYNDRVNPILYFTDYFPKPDKLLESMLYTDVYLSGSRSLNFFVPGSADENSDFDFYIDSPKQNIYNFMEDIKSNGVRWLSALEWFELKLNNKNSISTIIPSEIVLLNTNKDIYPCKQSTKKAIKDLFDAYKEQEAQFLGREKEDLNVTVIDEDGDKKTFISRDDIYSRHQIIRGILQYQNKKYKIQLIITIDRKMTVILDFYSSAVQSVITGFCATHMYAKDAYQRKSIIWDSDIYYDPNKQKITSSIEKYKKRGYTFYKTRKDHIRDVYQNDTAIKRSLKDSESHTIDFDIDLSEGYSLRGNKRYRRNEYLNAKRRLFYEYAWVEYGGSLMLDMYTQDMQSRVLQSTVGNIFSKLAALQSEDRRERALSSLQAMRWSAIDPCEELIKDTQKSKYSVEMPERYMRKYIN